MENKFFKNSGIQFFAIKEALDMSSGDAFTDNFLRYYDLFSKNWFPLSLNGQRNTLMFRIIDRKKGSIMFAIDTNLNKGDEGNEDFHGIHSTHAELIFEYDEVGNKKLNQISSIIGQKLDEVIGEAVSVPKITELYLNEFKDNLQSNEPTHNIFKEQNRNSFLTETKGIPLDFKIIYQHLVYNLVEKNKHEFKIKMLDLNSEQYQRSNDVALILDLGNTRSIGLLLEKNKNNEPQINNVNPLWMINFKELTSKKGIEYLENYEKDNFSDYLIPSKMIFRKDPFYDFHNDGDSEPDYQTFKYPGIIAFGREAQTTLTGEDLSDSSELSGPKRYLWSTEALEDVYWKFNDGDDLRGEVLTLIDYEDVDNYGIDTEIIPYKTWPRASASKSTMMIFAMIEIIYQAYCQINSLHYRAKTGQKNRLRELSDIYLSFPTGMPIWERRLLKERVETALDILIRINAIKIHKEENLDFYTARSVYLKAKKENKPANDLVGFYQKYNNLKEKVYPKVSLGFDEAACSQIAFLYGKSKSLNNQMSFFYNFFGTKNPVTKENNIRIASLDIGGGTSDLSINDFTLQDDGGEGFTVLDKKHIFSDGVNKAGDDIIKALIEKLIIPQIIQARAQNKRKEAAELLTQHLGIGNTTDESLNKRVALLNHILLPIAYFYLYYLEHYDNLKIREFIESLEISNINEFLESINYPLIQLEDTLLSSDGLSTDENKAIKWLDEQGRDLINYTRLKKILDKPKPDTNTIKRIIGEELIPIFANYSQILNQFNPSFLLISGKISAIPFIKEALKDYLPVSPERIIRLNNHNIGRWYPFKDVYGNIKDPKTTVVVGNMIGYATENCNFPEFKFTKDHDGTQRTPFKINYMQKQGEKDAQDKPIYFYDSNKKGGGVEEVVMTGFFNVCHTTIKEFDLLANVIYNVSFKNKKSQPALDKNDYIRITFDCSDPESMLKIDTIKGRIDVEGNGIFIDIQKEHIKVRRQTLEEENYYLDDPSFNIHSKIQS